MNNSKRQFTVRLTMLSDWHIGTGAGRPGNIDKLLARDAEDFPFVPAKTLNGIWRDAMEVLTFGLDGGTKYEWQRFVEAIFGNQPALPGSDPTIRPFSSILKIQPARLNENLQKKIKSLDKTNERKFLAALTLVKPGVAIDGESGTARPDFLRFEEMGRVGTVLEANCELRYCNDTIWALLIASAKLVERIGGKRRRGAGRCRLEVLEASGDEIQYLQSFKDKDTPSVPDIPKQTMTNDVDLQSSKSSADWQRLEFSLYLQSPVSIVTATLGNVSESLDFIPGTYILPHFTKVLGKQLGKEFFQAVAYGDFQVLPATIEINNNRGLPVPKAIYYDKVGGGFDKKRNGKSTVYCQFTEEEKIKEGEQKKAYRSGYVSSLDENGETLPLYKNTRQTLLMHNTVEDKSQRPTTDVGGVYSRQAIAAETNLRGEIRLRKSVADRLGENWWKVLEEKENRTLRLGASSKDDYGLADLQILGEPEQFASQVLLNENTLIVYLLSDVLIRNANLRQTNLVEDFASELCRKLNEDVDDENKKLQLRRKDSLIQTRRIESWHEGWGFPRPTLTAMSAGSCIRFEITNGNPDLDKLRQLEAEGIGERRGEGYGQIRFNPPLLTGLINDWEEADKPDDIQKKNGDSPETMDASEFVKQIEEAVWRKELQIAVLKVADNPAEREKTFGFELEDREGNKLSKPPMSQIGGLRSVISRLQKFDDAKIVAAWLYHLGQTRNRREKWDRDKETAEKKLGKIRRLVEEKSEVWRILREAKARPDDEEAVWQKPVTLTSRDLEKDEKLWAEAVRTVFDACVRAHKRELEKPVQKKEKQDGATN